MAERGSDERYSRQQAARERVKRAEEGGYPPTVIDAAMARGDFDLTPDGRESIYFASMPPVARPMARRGIDGPQLESKL